MIKKQNIYEQVIEHLHQYIRENELRSGDRLPTETELAEQFGVGRQSIREAIKVLESVGVVETRPRDGSRLRELNIGPLSEHLRFMFELEGVTLREMGASRSVIECAALPLVVECAEEEDFVRLERAIARMRESMARRDEAAWIQSEMEFHKALLAATRNRIVQGFGGILHEFFLRLGDRIVSSEESKRHSIEEHERIYRALRDGDTAAAVAVMSRHLSVYEQFGTRPMGESPRTADSAGKQPALAGTG